MPSCSTCEPPSTSDGVDTTKKDFHTTTILALTDEQVMFEPSSTDFLVQQVVAAQDPRQGIAQQISEALSLHDKWIADPMLFPVSSSRFALPYDRDVACLPERQLADAMLCSYWQDISIILPVLHQPSFDKLYNCIWQCSASPNPLGPNKPRDNVFGAILNMVFALGSQRCNELAADIRHHAADSFYKKSLRLVSLDALDYYSLELVQLLCLRTMYLILNSNSAACCWNTCGSAVRAAQGLNLNLAVDNASQLEREMTRRAWHGVILLHRYVKLPLPF